MNETLTDRQRILVVNALKNYYFDCPDELKDEITWLIDLIDLKRHIILAPD